MVVRVPGTGSPPFWTYLLRKRWRKPLLMCTSADTVPTAGQAAGLGLLVHRSHCLCYGPALGQPQARAQRSPQGPRGLGWGKHLGMPGLVEGYAHPYFLKGPILE